MRSRIKRLSMPSVRRSMSTNTGVKPQCSTAAMSETQVIGGTMTSPGPAGSRRAAIVTRLAEEPELTKTLCFTPSQRGPFLLEGPDLLRLGQDQPALAGVLRQEANHFVEVVPRDVVLHQRPVEMGKHGCAAHRIVSLHFRFMPRRQDGADRGRRRRRQPRWLPHPSRTGDEGVLGRLTRIDAGR